MKEFPTRTPRSKDIPQKPIAESSSKSRGMTGRQDVSNEEQLRDGYKAAYSLGRELHTAPSTIESVAEHLIKRNRDLLTEVQRRARIHGYHPDAYSPKLAELIRKELGEPLRKGYRTAGSIRGELQTSVQRINKIVEELITKTPSLATEVQIKARVRSGGNTDAYSPRLVELIKQKLGERVKEGYRIASSIRELKSNSTTIEAAVSKLIQRDQTLLNEIQRGARTESSTSDAYSPRLVELIKQELGEPIREGYWTSKSLVLELKTSAAKISEIMETIIKRNPSLEKEIQKSARLVKGPKTDAYSPRLAELIKQELGEPIREGYRTASSLAIETRTSVRNIRNTAEWLVKTNPSLISEMQINARGGFIKTYAYSPALVDMISESVLRRKSEKEIADKQFQGERKLEQDCNNFFGEISEEKTLEAKEFKQLLNLLGPNHIFDVLYKYRPDFKGLPVDYVRGTIAKYLGDFLISRSNFRLEDVDICLAYLSDRTFQDSLFEVVREGCLHYYHERKLVNRHVSDSEIIGAYINSIQEKAARINSPEFNNVVNRVEEYWQTILGDFQKPDGVIDVLRQNGRPFPDLDQVLNIKEIKDKKKMLIGDEMGMGKSASAILAKEYLGSKLALIVVPSNVISVWSDYLSDKVSDDGEQVGYFKPGMSPRVLVAEDPSFLEGVDTTSFDFILISQERMNNRYYESLQGLGYDMLIVDEIHKLKNLQRGKRAEQIVKLAEKIQGDKHLILLSGTPVPNKVKDVAMILKLLYPERFKKVKDGELVQSIINGDLVDIRNLLVPRMQMKTLRESVEMPDIIERTLPTVLSQEEKEIYEVLLEDDELTASEKIRTFRKFVMNPFSLEVTPSFEGTKINDAKNHLHEVFQVKDRVVMIVNGYVEGMIRGGNTIIERLHLSPDIAVRVIEGEISTEERQNIQRELKETKGKILLVVSGQTADVGVDFSSAQSVLVYNEPWTKYDKQQQIARVYRPGLNEDLEVITSVAQGTIEEGIQEYITLKYDAIQKLLKGVPITEIERGILRQAEKSTAPDIEGDVAFAKEWLNSAQNRLHRFFGITKEIGEKNFHKFLLEHGEEYAESYLDMGSRGFQANTGRVVGTLIDRFVKERSQTVDDVNILDIASGPEMLKTHIGDQYKDKVFSLDINALHFQGEGENRIVGSFLNLPIKDKSIDYANLSLALHYTRFVPTRGDFERLQVFQEINRVLKKGGRAVMNLLYSLRFKDEDRFRGIVEASGFKIVEQYTGDISSGLNYRSHCVVLEKQKDVTSSLDNLIEQAGRENLDGLKFKESKTTLKNSRRIIRQVSINNRNITIAFNKEDQKVFAEEQGILQEGERLIGQYGVIKAIPAQQIIEKGFLRINNGKTYRLLKKSDKIGGFVTIR